VLYSFHYGKENKHATPNFAIKENKEASRRQVRKKNGMDGKEQENEEVKVVVFCKWLFLVYRSGFFYVKGGQ
jgi:hypothetical protein